MGRPFPVLVNCTFGYLHIHAIDSVFDPISTQLLYCVIGAKSKAVTLVLVEPEISSLDLEVAD
jgi:hypothetical protein